MQCNKLTSSVTPRSECCGAVAGNSHGLIGTTAWRRVSFENACGELVCLVCALSDGCAARECGGGPGRWESGAAEGAGVLAVAEEQGFLHRRGWSLGGTGLLDHLGHQVMVRGEVADGVGVGGVACHQVGL